MAYFSNKLHEEERAREARMEQHKQHVALAEAATLREENARLREELDTSRRVTALAAKGADQAEARVRELEAFIHERDPRDVTWSALAKQSSSVAIDRDNARIAAEAERDAANARADALQVKLDRVLTVSLGAEGPQSEDPVVDVQRVIEQLVCDVDEAEAERDARKTSDDCFQLIQTAMGDLYNDYTKQKHEIREQKNRADAAEAELREVRRRADTLIFNLLLSHPAPWHAEHDWAPEVIDANGKRVLVLGAAESGECFVEMANRKATQLKFDADEIEAILTLESPGEWIIKSRQDIARRLREIADRECK